MATLLSNAKLGNTGISGLLKSATTLANEINTFKDAQAAQDFALSTKTSDDLNGYQSYLTGRISTLSATGSVTDATKAISLQNTLTSAIKANGASDIQRENIQIMAGNSTLQDKYNVITGQYVRALNIGDLSLAQSLESQAYSVSQSIQYQATQAAAAASTLHSAALSAKVSYQGEVVKSLDNGLKELNFAAKNLSEKDFNNYAQKFVQANAPNLAKLGVVLPKGAQPNYFDIVSGVVGAKYNALVLKAQAEVPINPQTAQNYAYEAKFLNEGATKISTLGGALTVQEIRQAAADPAMFAYDNSSGSYKRTTQTGYQYLNGELAPTYSGIVSGKAASQFYFLSATETAQLHTLGFNITAKLNPNGTVGAGIDVQATDKTPQWLQSIFGKNGTAQFYNQNGQLSFKSGEKFYTVSKDASGLAGLYEHEIDGTSKLVGGDYGFHSGAASLLLNQAQQTQQQISIANQTQAAALKAATPPPLPNISLAPPPPAPRIGVPKVSAPQIVPVTHNPQGPTVNPQTPAGVSLQGGGVRLQ